VTAPTRKSAPTAVIVRDNRILLAKRPVGKAFAGLYETPGGKAEPGETDEEALSRELREELGEDSRPMIGARLLEVTLDPPVTAQSYRLPVHYVTLHGEPKALAAENLGWYTLAEVDSLTLTPTTEQAIRHPRVRHLLGEPRRWLTYRVVDGHGGPDHDAIVGLAYHEDGARFACFGHPNYGGSALSINEATVERDGRVRITTTSMGVLYRTALEELRWMGSLLYGPYRFVLLPAPDVPQATGKVDSTPLDLFVSPDKNHA